MMKENNMIPHKMHIYYSPTLTKYSVSNYSQQAFNNEMDSFFPNILMHLRMYSDQLSLHTSPIRSTTIHRRSGWL